MGKKYYKRSPKKHPQQRALQLTLNFLIPGDSSIKPLSDEEIILRIQRTSNPRERANGSFIGLPERLFQIVHDGLLNEYFNARRGKR